MLTPEKIQELKAQHGGSLFQTQVEGVAVIFRALTVGEYTTYHGEMITTDVAEEIVRLAVLYPEEGLQFQKVGQLLTLAQYIINSSGWSDDAFLETLREKRRIFRSDIGQIVVAIADLFKLRPKEVLGMDRDTFLDYAVAAEVRTDTAFFNDPEDPQGAKSRAPLQKLPERVHPGQALDPQTLALAGVAPAVDALQQRLLRETGQRPTTVEEYKQTGRVRHLKPRPGLDKTVDWDGDLKAYKQAERAPYAR